MSTEESEIICNAVQNADCWGAGRITTSREAIEDAGYTWTEEHECFIFTEFVVKEEDR